MNRARSLSGRTLPCASISLLWVGTLVCLTDAKGTYYRHPVPIPYGNRYNLYTSGSSPQLTPGKPLGKHKAFAAVTASYRKTTVAALSRQDEKFAHVLANANKEISGLGTQASFANPFHVV
ncbi:UNVERIFIED_CONTAM: hypothetical protein K2H54_066136 [Gekko kuhli]